MGGYRRIRSAAWTSVAVVAVAAVAGCSSGDDDEEPGAIGGTQASPSALEFPDTPVGRSARLDLVIDNAAEAEPVTIEAVAIAGTDAAMFSHGFDGSEGELGAGESTTVSVVFSPTTVGARTATLGITQSDDRELSIPLSGSALPPAPSSLLVVGAPELNSSTYSHGSIRLTNESPEGQQIASLQIDLSTSILPDVVFDPDGTAGDVLSRGFLVQGNPGVGTIGHSFAGPHDLGYDVLAATFTDFVPGKTVGFAIDIDPTTIRGAEPPGPGETGSVSGLELAGATVTVTYEDGTSQEGRLFRSPDSLGQSEVRLDGAPRPLPTLEVVDVPETPGSVSAAGQTIRVTAPSGSTVRLLQVEGALFTAGLPDGGFDLDPFEANSLVAVTEQEVTIGPSGSADVEVTLTSTNPEGGNNRFLAAVADTTGPGPTSDVVTLQLG
jgi:hypothetical protein